MNNTQFIIYNILGVSSFTTLGVLIARFAIKHLGDLSIEKYKHDLVKEHITFKGQLDKELENFKIQYQYLYAEQISIVRAVYEKLIKAERDLEYLMRPLKLAPEKNETELAQITASSMNSFFNFFEENEIIFSEDICKIISSIKKTMYQVYKTNELRDFMGDGISHEMAIELSSEMIKAYDEGLNVDLQNLKSELKGSLRGLLGVITEKSNERH